MNDAKTKILIRATVLDDQVLRFADEVAAASDCPVVFLVDESGGRVDHRDRAVIGITPERCRALGLYCPRDFAWRCGDYGYYLARFAFPDVVSFWMIEYDVRISGDDRSEFFRFFQDRPDIDFIAADLRTAEADWWWTVTARGRGVQAYRCLFPVTRLSARAIDAALVTRVRHSSQKTRRMVWPNDEAHVATTLKNEGFSCRDVNDFGREFYTDSTFTFQAPMDGDATNMPHDRVLLFHPVLHGDAYRRKLERLVQGITEREAFLRRWGSRINRYRRW